MKTWLIQYKFPCSSELKTGTVAANDIENAIIVAAGILIIKKSWIIGVNSIEDLQLKSK